VLAEYRNDFVNVANVMHAHLADLAFLDEQEELEPMRLPGVAYVRIRCR
jgi:hypothetical protein